jgi:MoxR-like ATPase
MPFHYIVSGRQTPEQQDLPSYRTYQYTQSKHYFVKPELADAINVALYTNQPLLITGEPGTGKTQLAARIVWELKLNGPLVFHTKSTSVSTDLFYTYNALARFHAAQTGEKLRNGTDFIKYNALGEAILLSNTTEDIHKIENDYDTKLVKHHAIFSEPKRSIVLIDEIDKAPRDFPNDLLHEIETCEFEIPELNNARIKAHPDCYPVVIITSNSEKHLPDAFLRRCVYYHIPFPDLDEMRHIVLQRLKDMVDLHDDDFLLDALTLFYELRNQRHSITKRPSTAELLIWLQMLRKHSSTKNPIREDKERVKQTLYSILIKTKDDLPIAKRVVEKWLSNK